MRLIGGLVFWDPTHPTRTLAEVRAIARRAAGLEAPHVTGNDSHAAFSFLGRDSVESTPEVSVVADLDLTNADELRDVAGLSRERGGLLTRLYDLEGPSFVRRLQGAFALILYDRRRRTLLGAVDRFGMRRLYYATDARRTVFASRAGALRAAEGVEGAVDLAAVYEYLNFGCVPAPGSIYVDIRRLPPGHVLRVEAGGEKVEPYWDLTYTERPVRVAEGAARLQSLAQEAVGRTLAGATPKETGAFLSGGTDSSTVVGLIGRVTGERVNAFSIGFGEERYNELRYAELAARHFGATHYTRTVTADDALAALPRLVEAYDEPFGNNSAIGTLFCAELARECGVRRLLAGDGGDEIFGGNERYRIDRVYARYHRLPAIVRRGLLEPVLLGLPDRGPGLLGRAQRYIRRANLPNPARFYSWEFFVARHAAELLAPDFLAVINREGPSAVVRAHFDRARGASELNRLLYLDLKITIGDNDLFKVVRTAEVAGMDVRFPLLDAPLVDYTATLPARFKVRGLEKRYLFKRAFRELLPPEILAKRKHGFGVPTSIWLESHPAFRAFARDTLLSARARQRGYFRLAALERLFDLHTMDGTAYYGDLLWTVLMLELWHQRHVDGAVAA